MRALVQRVSSASVSVGGEELARIDAGVLVLVGVTHGDTEAESSLLANKIANLRIFPDAEGKMNVSLLDAGHAAIVVSQFTLYGDARKGRRPSFVHAAQPDVASPLVDHLADELRRMGVSVGQGRFGAEMAVALVNDGPVTIWLDTRELRAAGG